MHVKYDQQFALSRISTHVRCSSPDPRAAEDGENYFKRSNAVFRVTTLEENTIIITDYSH